MAHDLARTVSGIRSQPKWKKGSHERLSQLEPTDAWNCHTLGTYPKNAQNLGSRAGQRKLSSESGPDEVLTCEAKHPCWCLTSSKVRSYIQISLQEVKIESRLFSEFFYFGNDGLSLKYLENYCKELRVWRLYSIKHEAKPRTWKQWLCPPYHVTADVGTGQIYMLAWHQWFACFACKCSINYSTLSSSTCSREKRNEYPLDSAWMRDWFKTYSQLWGHQRQGSESGVATRACNKFAELGGYPRWTKMVWDKELELLTAEGPPLSDWKGCVWSQRGRVPRFSGLSRQEGIVT